MNRRDRCASRSDFVRLRGLRYHVRSWGESDSPVLILAHGWMDLSATFDPVARALARNLRVLAPDWRGFGHTEWPQEGYWFPDYVADLDAIVDHYVPAGPVFLAGHSMGAQIVSLYAGLRPQRVSRLAILDGLFLPDGDVASTPQRFAKWLDEVREDRAAPSYASFEELAGRIRKRHPKLDEQRCAFIARCWGRQDARGRVQLLSDPRHLRSMPRPYRQAESDAIWACVEAQTLFVDGAASPLIKTMPVQETARRRALFRDRHQTSIEGAGHMLHFEKPAELAEVLAGFFRVEGADAPAR